MILFSMTLEELRYRQSWTFEQKIDHAVGAIEYFINHMSKQGKGVYISFSGGKDSTVLLDMVRRFIDPDHNIPVVFCNTGNEWPDTVRFVKTFDNVTIIRPEYSLKKIFEREGFPLISKEQSQYICQYKHAKSERIKYIRLYGKVSKKGYKQGMISKKWQFLINENFMLSDKCCHYLKKQPFYRYEKENNCFPIIGILTEESTQRESEYIKRGGCNAFDMKRPASFPISIFTEQDILEYKRLFNIPFSPIYDDPRVKQTGCCTCGFGAHEKDDYRFELLYDLRPNFYMVAMNYTNNGVTYREALRKVGVQLPDEVKQYSINF